MDRELLPDVQFGDQPEPEELAELPEVDDEDDDEWTRPAPEVVEILGFDPTDE